jgi:hypothetical protein
MRQLSCPIGHWLWCSSWAQLAFGAGDALHPSPLNVSRPFLPGPCAAKQKGVGR